MIGTDQCRAEIAWLGAQLESLKSADGREYLWQRDPQWWGGCAPVLFPIVGALRKGRTVINGHIYEMPQHGLARRREFSLLSHTENEAVFALRADELTKKQYPFDFELQIIYRAEGASLATIYRVFNRGSAPMPYAIGGHPAFNIPLAGGERFEDYRIEFEHEETVSCPSVLMEECLIDPSHMTERLHAEKVIPLTHDLFYGDALIFEGLSSRAVTLCGGKEGHGLTMEFASFPMLGIWSAKNDGPFVALEPWCGCATRTDENDEFAEKRWMRMLPAGQMEEFSYTVTIF